MPSPNVPVLCCPVPDRILPVFTQVVSPPIGWAPLPYFLVVGLWSPSGDTGGPSDVFDAFGVPCPGPLHLLTIAVYICDLYPLSDNMLIFLFLYMILSILLFILVCAASSLSCACLASAHTTAPYVIADSTQELYTCLVRQMAIMLFKRYPFLACRPACHDSCCIFVSSSFP